MTMKRISPVNQAGSWQLKDYLVVVGKSTGSGYPVQILRMPKMDIVMHETVWDASSPFTVAGIAIRRQFGPDSDEYYEFLKYYVDKRDDPAPRKMKMSLDGVEQRVPKWARPPRG